MIILYVASEPKSPIRFTNRNGDIERLGYLLDRSFPTSREPTACVWYVPGTME